MTVKCITRQPVGGDKRRLLHTLETDRLLVGFNQLVCANTDVTCKLHAITSENYSDEE